MDKPHTAELRPVIQFEDWHEAFNYAYNILSLCESTAKHLAQFTPDNKNDWEKNIIMGASEFDIANGIELVKMIIPFIDIEKVIKC